MPCHVGVAEHHAGRRRREQDHNGDEHQHRAGTSFLAHVHLLSSSATAEERTVGDHHASPNGAGASTSSETITSSRSPCESIVTSAPSGATASASSSVVSRC